jgi:hypothetical protein
MDTTRRITAAAIALAAGLFLTGCDDPEKEDTGDPAETSIQQDEDGGDAGGDTQEDGANEGDDAADDTGDDEGEGLGDDDSDTNVGDTDDDPASEQ